jgi:hypothetical protein
MLQIIRSKIIGMGGSQPGISHDERISTKAHAFRAALGSGHSLARAIANGDSLLSKVPSMFAKEPAHCIANRLGWPL